jgi:5'-3' exonuclease
MDYMINIYKSLYTSESTITDTKNFINMFEFTRFIQKLADNEKSLLQDQLLRQVEYPDHTLLSCKKLDGSLDFEKYSEKYYAKMNISRNNLTDEEYIKQKKNVCKNYATMIGVILAYYSNGFVSWEQAYHYHYTPLMTDLAVYLSEIVYTNKSNVKTNVPHTKWSFALVQGSPSTAFEQLLSVLHPMNSYLLPNCYNVLFHAGKLYKSGAYPSDFMTELEGEELGHEYKAVVLLPIISRQKIKEEYNRIKFEILENREYYKIYPRDSLGWVWTIKYSLDKRTIYYNIDRNENVEYNVQMEPVQDTNAFYTESPILDLLGDE